MIRRLCSEDAPLLRSVRLQALSDAPFAFRGTLAEETDFPSSFWQDMLRADENPFFIVENGTDVCGVCGAFAPGVDFRAQLWFLWLLPSKRGLGNSDELVEHVIEWAKRNGAASLLLHVTDGNVHAENLYLRHGFRRTGVSIERERDGVIEFEMELTLAPTSNR